MVPGTVHFFNILKRIFSIVTLQVIIIIVDATCGLSSETIQKLFSHSALNEKEFNGQTYYIASYNHRRYYCIRTTSVSNNVLYAAYVPAAKNVFEKKSTVVPLTSGRIGLINQLFNAAPAVPVFVNETASPIFTVPGGVCVNVAEAALEPLIVTDCVFVQPFLSVSVNV